MTTIADQITVYAPRAPRHTTTLIGATMMTENEPVVAREPVAILGAGLMGAGIAELFARAGYPVRLLDIRKGVAQCVADEILRRSDRAGTSIQAFDSVGEAVDGASFVLEAISENLEKKAALFKKVCAYNSTATLASNTSSLLPSAIAAALDEPGRFIVTHFFNSPLVVPLVEIVPAPTTSPGIVEQTRVLIDSIGKQSVVLKHERPGFVANRLQAAILREAFALERDGVASFSDIDLVVRAALGSRWAAAGPLTVADLGGLDVWKSVLEQLLPDLANDQTPPTVINELVARGHLGSKTGDGIYRHVPEDDEEVRERMRQHFELEFHRR